jgi:hypothetical protein
VVDNNPVNVSKRSDGEVDDFWRDLFSDSAAIFRTTFGTGEGVALAHQCWPNLLAGIRPALDTSPSVLGARALTSRPA